jgi:hypothetical protein
MPELLPGLSQLRLPRMIRVRQRFDSPVIDDVDAAVRAAMAPVQVLPGKQSYALAVGSRGIAQLPTVVRALVAALKEKGGDVLIVPAMGSHGGATAEGQRDVLARLGVDEQTVGAPVRATMEAIRIGQALGVDVFMDVRAMCSHWIIPIARVKPHTGFRGPVESGICKMLAIGLGKHIGCTQIHRQGYERFPALIPAAAQVALDTGKIPFALALIENAREQLAHIELVPGPSVMTREPELLNIARGLMPRLLMPEIDVLVVEEIGKDISGVGMDSNVTGRGLSGPLGGFTGPKITRIVALNLTTKTHGNAVGVGQADIITQKLYDAIDRTVTYTNALTSGSLANGKIPVVLPTEEQAIMAAASCVPGVRAEDARIVRIKNTLQLEELHVSENMVEMLRGIGVSPMSNLDG